jgi:hypothetical protein
MFSLAALAACSRATDGASTAIPHLRKQGTATQLIVDGKPFLALAGELGNNTATSLEYMKLVWPKLAEARLNTVLAGVSWAQIEPQEGKFDFSVLDGVIEGARSHNLRLVLLWFASWKNGLSGYPPDWVKRDFERFPRAQIVDGTLPMMGAAPRTQIAGSRTIELLTPLSDANRDADARAFAAMMRHIKAVDGRAHTVIMIQVENEVGMQGDTRDRSPLADQAYDGPVPKDLLDYLQQHKDTLIPELRQVWEAAGFKTSGTWEEVFGKGRPAEEIFMAWHFARYVGRVVEAGKAEYPIPMYVNCPQEGFGKRPRGGQSGGPMPDAMDVWRAGAPRIDLFGTDIYDPDFVMMCARYTQSGNPLFIAETRGLPPNALGTRVLYAFGRHDAIGFSPMGIERPSPPDVELTSAYEVIAQLAPLILEHQGDGAMSAVVVGSKDPPQKIQVGNYTLAVSFRKPPGVPGGPQPQEPFPNSAAIFIATGPDEFYAAGNGVTVTFTPNTPGPPLAGLATVEEGVFVNGRWVPGRRLAGDDAGQGENLVLPRLYVSPSALGWTGGLGGPSTKGIQRVTLYRYQ